MSGRNLFAEPQAEQNLSAEQLNRLDQMNQQEAMMGAQRADDLKMNPMQAAAVGAGSGMNDIYRFFASIGGGGQGVSPISGSTPQGEAMARDQLVESNPVAGRVGEFVGQTVATAPLGGLAGMITKRAATWATKMLGQKASQFVGVAAGGAAEGAAVAGQLGEDMSTGAIVGSIGNVLFPTVLRRGKEAFQKFTGKAPIDEVFDPATGNLTQTAQDTLKGAGIPLEVFAAEVEESLKRNFDPMTDLAPQVRQAQLDEFAGGVQGRPSRMTQSQGLQNAEENLIALGTPQGNRIANNERIMQEQLMSGAQTKLLGDIDVQMQSLFTEVSNDANKGFLGDSVQGAVKGLQQIENQKVKALYQGARDLVGDGQEVLTDNIGGMFENAANDLAAGDQTIGAVGRALREFGVFEEGSELFDQFTTKAPREIKPLTLDNAEMLRQRLNQIDPRDGTQDSLFVDLVRRQLDNEVDGLIDAFPEEAAAAEAFRRARKASAEYKTAYEQRDLVGKLLQIRKGTKDIPQIAPEKVLDNLLRSSEKEVLKLKQLMLEKPTPESRQAWNEMRFVMIDELLRQTMDVNGMALNGQKLNQAVKRIGDTKLKMVLGEDKFKQLQRYQDVLGLQTLPLVRAENRSGTGGIVAQSMNSLSKLIEQFGEASTGNMGLVSKANSARQQRGVIRQALEDIESAYGRSGSVKRLKAEKALREAMAQLMSVTAVSAVGQPEDANQP